jgi:hypothetical protein
MYFHLRWSGPTRCFDQVGYYPGDGCHRGFSQQQEIGGPSQKNRTIQNAKLDHPVSLKKIEAIGQQRKQWVRKSGSFVEASGSGQNKEGPRGES